MTRAGEMHGATPDIPGANEAVGRPVRDRRDAASSRAAGASSRAAGVVRGTGTAATAGHAAGARDERIRSRPVTVGLPPLKPLPPLPPPKPDPMAAPPDPVSAMNVANYITVLRIALVPVFAVFLVTDGGRSDAWRIGAFAIFALAALTDRLDGELARRRNLITDFGKLADPIADKALMGTALIGLSTLGLLWWWVTIVILLRELGITALRLWVLRHGVLPASRGGKLKTLLQSVAIGLFVLPLPFAGQIVADVIMAAAVVATVITGVDYWVKAIRLRRVPAGAAS